MTSNLNGFDITLPAIILEKMTREEHTQTIIERVREREKTAATVPTDRSSPVKKRRGGRGL